MRLAILDPRPAGLVGFRVARILAEKHEAVGVMIDASGRRLHRLLQLRHDEVDAGRERFCLLRAQIPGERLDVGVDDRLGQQKRRTERARADLRGVLKVAEGLEMPGPFRGIVRNERRFPLDEPVADRIEHRRVPPHRVHQAERVPVAPIGERPDGRHL